MTAEDHSKPAAGRYTISSNSAWGHQVVDPEGKPVGEPTRYLGEALQRRDAAQREADRRAKRGPRPCMCCGRTFASEGIHHRLCNWCRARGQELPAAATMTSNGAKVRVRAGLASR